MKPKTKILIAEHDLADLELILHELEIGGINYVSQVVQNEQDYTDALEHFVPDIILSDYAFPSFSGVTAFKIRQKKAPDTPFIFVSGTIGEEKSVELIRNGATDYALKDSLFTLNPKLIRALKEVKERKEKNEKEKELIRSEKKYRQIVETAQEGIWLIDENNFTTLVNKKMASILEYTQDEMIGKQHYFFMDDEVRKKAAGYKLGRKPGINENNDFKYITKSGKDVWTNSSANPVYDDAGIYKGVLSMVTDITKRKLAEEKLLATSDELQRALAEQVLSNEKIKESETRLKEAQAIAHLGHWELNFSTKMAKWSDEACNIYGLPNEANQPAHSTRESFIHPDDLDYVMAANLESQETFSDTELNHRIILEDGTVKYVASKSKFEFDKDGTAVGLYGVVHDVTERKLFEIRLNELNRDLQKQAKELAVSNEELEQFAYVASHDLQEPLRMVTSFLIQLEKKYGDVIDERGKKYIGFAVDGAKRMRQIILDLLEFSRIGRTDDDLENIDLNELVHEIQVLFGKQIEEKNATIIFDTLPKIQAHRSPMRQVFQNLVGNALKYTRKNIPALIRITATELKTHWQFAVADNGIGIEEEYFDKIFIIFQRLHNRDEFSGTGMGLAVTKKIIEHLGGKMWVESEEGKGSTFYFTLQKHF